MKPREYQWAYPKTDAEWAGKIVNEFHIHPVTARILVARGFTSFENIHFFLYAKLRELHHPKLFWDMQKAVKRIVASIKQKKPILEI